MPRALWLLLLPVLLMYGASLGFPYVWDDHHLIAGLGGPQAALGERLATAIGPFLDVYFRPLTLSMIALELEAGSRASVASHAVSVALFGVLVIGLVRWLKAEQISWRTAGLVGLVFATLPLATEAVLWVSARGDLLVAVFGVLALRETALRFPVRVDGVGEVSSADGGRLVLLGFLVLGALLSKESGIAVATAVMLRAQWPTFIRQGGRGARGLWLLTPLLLTALVFGVRSVVLSDLSPPELPTPEWTDHGLLVLAALGTMLQAILWPYAPDMAIGISAPPIAGDPAPIIGLAGLAVLLGLTWAGRLRGARRVGLAAALLLVFLAPTSQLIPIELSTMTADRYLLLPWLALALILGAGLEAGRTAENSRRIPLLFVASCCGLATAGGLVSWSRGADWQSEEHLFHTMYAEADSENGYPALVLGTHLAFSRRCGRALPILQEAEHKLAIAGRVRSAQDARNTLDACEATRPGSSGNSVEP
ncbi:MAG: hypothetical protein VX498_09515 [Myxococcota bacterium]|nr:hypothetical protein [Myxococcota bacterium]